jgi:prevent-host-death family protein
MVYLTKSIDPHMLVNITNRVGIMATVVNIYDAKTNLSDLVERAAAGEEVVIAKAGVPKVKLVPVPQPGMVREAGFWKGKIWTAPDWDAPLTEAELEEWHQDDGA